MQSNSIVIDFRAEKMVRSLSVLQLLNLRWFFNTEPNSDPYLYGLIKKEIKRRQNNSEMYEDYANAD